MTLYFAYGSNMSRTWMKRLCPKAQALGPAQLMHYRFLVMSAGYASVLPQAGDVVHGVLWRIAPGDFDALDRYEDVAGGLYDRCTLPVQYGGEQHTALVYVGRSRAAGRARSEYCEVVLRAARDWELPAHYIARLVRQLSAREGEAGEVA
ncbi:MAG: gamma-glutamylcyclotransferase [Xanthobacteraceae bacterium]|nr:gamma-glutamylcyclotransferase [Xanthobacteraceae bacterium]